MYANYGPPETDSEDDDYEGFSFGDEFSETPRQKCPLFVVDVDEEIYRAVTSGDLEKLDKELSTLTNFKINDTVRGGLTLLHHACRCGHVDIVKYLINEKNANPNHQIDSFTPLMEACCYYHVIDSDDDGKVAAVVKFLITKGAVVNVSDKYGMTPLMFAAKNGLASVVDILIKNNASLDTRDNQSYTPLFHAVENNHPKCVKLLIDAKVNLESVNRDGYTARQLAQFNLYEEVLNVFPLEDYKYFVPASYLSYNSVRDLMPRIFPIIKHDDDNELQPEYFPEIHNILLEMKMENFLEKFSLNKINFEQFLTMDYKKLKEIGIEYPIHRKKILLGLLEYHLHHWSNKSIAKVKGKEQENFYDILLILANHMKNAIIVKSSLVYVQQNLENGFFGKVSKDVVRILKNRVAGYKTEMNELEKTCRYLHSFTPEKPPLYINYDSYLKQKKKGKRIKQCFKYSILVSLPVVICLKIKKII